MGSDVKVLYEFATPDYWDGSRCRICESKWGVRVEFLEEDGEWTDSTSSNVTDVVLFFYRSLKRGADS